MHAWEIILAIWLLVAFAVFAEGLGQAPGKYVLLAAALWPFIAIIGIVLGLPAALFANDDVEEIREAEATDEEIPSSDTRRIRD